MTTMLLSENFPPATGGSSRWLWEIYRRMPRGLTRIAAGAQPGDAAFDRTHRLTVHRLNLSFDDWGLFSVGGYRDYARADREIERLVFRGNVHTIHCGRAMPEGYLAWRMRRRHGIAYFVYVHGEELNTVSTSRQLAWMARRVFAEATTVIANCRNTASILHRDWHVRPEQLTVLHPGVDAQTFRPAERCDTIRRRLGWGDRPVVLTVGRLQKRKGHDRMIEALRQVRHMTGDVLYAIAGDGAEAENLHALADACGVAQHVKWMGPLGEDDLIAAYQQCDLFVLPNREVRGDFEGFGMVLLEAQGCGRAVVAGRSGGTGETMMEDRTGLRVNADDVEALGLTVGGLLADAARRQAMGQAGRQWIVERFDWPVLARQAEALFARRVVAPRAAA